MSHPATGISSIQRGTLAAYRQAVASGLVRDVGETYVTRVGLMALGLLTSVLVARTLGPEGRGLFAAATTITAVGIQFGNLGLHASNTYLAARDPGALASLVGNSTLVSLGLGSALAIVLWIALWLWPAIAPSQGVLLALALASVPCGLAVLLYQSVLLGMRQIRTYNVIELASKALATVLVISIVWFGRMSAEAYLATALVGFVVGAALSLWRLLPCLERPPFMSLPVLRQNVSYALRAYFVALFAYLLIRADLLMVQHYLGDAQAGYYAVAASLADVLYLFPSVVGMVMFPRLSAMPETQDKWGATLRLSSSMVGIMLLFATISSLLAQVAIQFLYGELFLPATGPFIILSVAMVFLGANSLFSQHLASMGFPGLSVGVWVVGFLTNVLLNLVAIPAFGTMGAATSSLVAYALVLVVQYIYLARRNRLIRKEP